MKSLFVSITTFISIAGISSSFGSRDALGVMTLSLTDFAQSTSPYLSFGRSVDARAAGCQPAPALAASLAGPDLAGSPVPFGRVACAC
ncbi:MAG: hypothetical protein HZB81_02400 [Deltaproteobacteria bacterium]|nr:hypothetical protein [Deltaproteobacteria bacterium]